MKYTDEQFKARLLKALENSAYYSEKWGIEGGKEARESKGYYQGQADLMLELCGGSNVISIEKGRKAIQNGKDKYHSEAQEEY